MNNPTYWNHQGNYQHLYNKLNKLIPSSGEVVNARKNPALEKLRKASNCYYDLFNNGLCNRASEFYRVFGFGGKSIVKNGFRYSERLERAMDDIILVAAKEQGVHLEAHDIALEQIMTYQESIHHEAYTTSYLLKNGIRFKSEVTVPVSY